MSYLFIDTSAVVKRYTVEMGSVWLSNYLNPLSNNIPTLSEIALAEFAAAICAKHRAATIGLSDRTAIISLFLSHCSSEYQLLDVNRSVIDRAIELTQKYPLRGYDAVQLATGLISKEVLSAVGINDFVFISADTTLLLAAQSEGLVTENPNAHI